MPRSRVARGCDDDARRAQAAQCKACDLYKNATQVVFGEGPVPAPLMLMGEVPGDKEDKAGHPFVGPAGKILDDALAESGIDRSLAHLTNAVKHFKWVPARGGKVRLHNKPNQAEIAACRQWWERAARSPRSTLHRYFVPRNGDRRSSPASSATSRRSRPASNGR